MKKILISLPDAINLLPDAVVVLNYRAKIELANDMALTMFEYSLKELVGKNLNILIPKRLRPEKNKVIKNYLKKPTLRKMGEEIHNIGLRKDGSELDVDIALAPVEIEGKHLIFMSIRDVSEFKKLERSLLQRNEQLSIINIELERFGYIIAHDLKSPLLNLHAIMSLLKRELPEEKSHNLEMYMDALDATLRSMMNLISGVSDYSKVGFAGRIDECVNLSDVIQEVKSLLHIPAHVELKIPPKLPKLNGNRTKLLQIFLNLINNAIKYNDKPQGKIALKCRKHKKEYVFTISDNGPGVPVGLRNQIFGLFRKGNIQKEGSEGIGLAVVKKIINDQGGTITVTDSKLGGADFIFTWPLNHTPIPMEQEHVPNHEKPLKKAA